MAGYFGTDVQRRLQAQAESSVGFVESTPGACHTGRLIGCDDPVLLGWTQIDAILARDRTCGFRFIPIGEAESLKSSLAERGYRLDTWDVFIGDRAAAFGACESILSRALPEGLVDLDRPTDPEGALTVRIQSLMSASGVVPFSGSFLIGTSPPAITEAIGDIEGNVVAAATTYLSHTVHSPFHRYAWGGLVAVADAQRGKGLGARINARIVIDAFRELDATHVYELVSTTNMASRRMVASCGLHLEPAFVFGLATPIDNERFTR